MSMARVLLPWVALLTAIFLVAFAVPEAIEGLVVSRDAPDYTSIRAEVKGQFDKEHKIGPSTHVIEFTYRIDGRKYYGSNRFTLWADDADDVDDLVRKESDGKKTILVWYDPEQPKHSVIRRDVPIWPHLAWLGLTAIVLVWSVSSILGARRRKALVRRTRQSRPSSSSSSGTGSTGSTSSEGDAS